MDKIISLLADGAVAVTATGQQAAHLRWRYGRHQRALGKAAWSTPRVYLLSAWIEQAWEASLLAGGIGAERGLLTRSQARRLWHQVIGGDPEPSGPLLQLIDTAWRTLHDWNIDLADVARAGAGTDAERFYAWASSYRARCTENGWVDSVGAQGQIATELAGAPERVPGRLMFVGFQHWQPGLAHLAECVQQAGGVAGPVQAVGSASPRIRRIEFRDQSDELAAAAAWAGAGPDGAAEECIGLVHTDLPTSHAELQRRVLDQLRPDWRQRGADELPVAGPVKRPFAEHGPIHVALMTLQLLAARVDYQVISQLLRSAFLGEAEQERAARAGLDAWLREHGQRETELAVLVSKAGELAPQLGRRLDQARREPPPRRKSTSGWADWITHYLDALGWPGDGPLSLAVSEAVRAWQELLDRFSACGLVTGDIGFGEARRMLADMARTESASEAFTGRGVALLQPADALGQGFDALWIGGLHSEAWPPPMRPNPLIPLSVQRQAGVPDASPDLHAQQAGALLDSLLCAADQVVISVARGRADERLTPTPAIERFAAVDTSEDLWTHKPTLTETIALRPEVTVAPDAPPPLGPDEPPRGGARLLQLQAQCPARAFFELRLHARELAQPAFGIDAATRGKLVHAALEQLTETMLARNLTAAMPATRELVPELARASLRGRLPRSPLNRALTQLEEARLAALLNELLDLDADRPAFALCAPEASLPVTLGRLAFQLRVDRTDELQAGERLVIDYKTGSAKRRADWFGSRPAEPQLPLYAIGSGARAVAYVRLSEDGVSLDGIAAGDTGIDGIKMLSAIKQTPLEHWDELLAEWHRVLTALADEFAAGSCAIDSDALALAVGQYAPLTRAYELKGSA